MDITGIDFLVTNLEALKNPKMIENALCETGYEIFQRAEPKLPHKSGALKSSEIVVVNSPSNVDAGYNMEYAGFQEKGVRMDGTHVIKNRPAGGQSHFMASTLIEYQEYLKNFLAQSVERQVRQNIKLL